MLSNYEWSIKMEAHALVACTLLAMVLNWQLNYFSKILIGIFRCYYIVPVYPYKKLHSSIKSASLGNLYHS